MTLWGGLVESELAPFLLEVARVTGMMVLTPLPFEAAPRQVRTASVLFLAFVAHGMGGSAPQLGSVLGAAGHVVAEFIVGASIGLVVRMAIAAAEVAGTTLAPMIGFGAAQIFDPGTGQQDSVLTRFFRLFAILVALSVGLHRVVIASLLSSFSTIPVGSPIAAHHSAELFIVLSAGVIESGVRIAMPVLAVLLMVQLALGFIARAAPSMQIFNIGFTVFLGVGGVLLWFSLPDTGREFALLFSRVGDRIEAVLMAMARS